MPSGIYKRTKAHSLAMSAGHVGDLETYLKSKYRVLKNGCWQAKVIGKRHGYAMIGLNKKTQHLHRFFFSHYRKEPQAGSHIDHLCRNRGCVNPDHLEEVTPAENARRGLVAKLKSEQVVTIREMHASGITQKELASKFPVCQSQISRILSFKRWAVA